MRRLATASTLSACGTALLWAQSDAAHLTVLRKCAREGGPPHTTNTMTPEDKEMCLTNKGRDMTDGRTIYPAPGRITGAGVQSNLCSTATNINGRGLELIQINSTKAQMSFRGADLNISVRERIMFRHNSAWPIALRRG
uniref:ID835 n=1 Tax=Bradyrhizobium japonicum TaxID=375 RepID=Q9AMV5_BRAJP|nr:ID835 [Bradyrhizobium japonicum]